MKKISSLWLIAEIILIFCLLTFPGSNLPKVNYWGQDKIIHIILFGSLMYAALFHFDQMDSSFVKTTRARALTMIVCILYGIGMEFYQKYFVPTRGFEVSDMLADAAGVIMSLPLYQKLKQRK
ncbi:MAG: VanZ family protein [Sediminibacterium sp.]